MSILAYSRNTFSQNGEDGIIDRIFSIVGTTSKTCCEFGAWDGIHFSNCRQLVLSGWRCLFIEGDEDKYQDLHKNYASNTIVVCLNRYVSVDRDSVDTLLSEAGFPADIDFLSIDIDGLDYEVFRTLRAKPRVICVEVNAGHSPNETKRLVSGISQGNVGQPLACFVEEGKLLGYRLICYSGNAFFLRGDLGFEREFRTLSSADAYKQFLNELDRDGREWLYLVNKGWAPPYHRYQNELLEAHNLGISCRKRALWVLSRSKTPRLAKRLLTKLKKKILDRREMGNATGDVLPPGP